MNPHIESSYHLTSGLAVEQACSGLTGYVARGPGSDRPQESPEPSVHVYCLGKCHAAPARASDAEEPSVAIQARDAVVAQHLTPTFEAYRSRESDPGAYIDRFILEENPRGVIEALAIAGYAVGARRGHLYLRAECPKAGRLALINRALLTGSIPLSAGREVLERVWRVLEMAPVDAAEDFVTGPHRDRLAGTPEYEVTAVRVEKAE
jgi:hypothetical protein